MIGQFIRVGRAGWKMLRELLARGCYRLDKTVCGLAFRNILRQSIDDCIPRAGHDLVVYACIGQHLGIALCHRNENQHARSAGGGVQVLH